MAEKIKDAEDLLLESLFRSEPIADAGFSERVVKRIRRAIWIRRLALPLALLAGTAIALRPLLQLGQLIAYLGDKMPGFSISVPASMATQWPVVLIAGSLLLVAVLVFLLSED